jgi:hypothetical protein
LAGFVEAQVVDVVGGGVGEVHHLFEVMVHKVVCAMGRRMARRGESSKLKVQSSRQAQSSKD